LFCVPPHPPLKISLGDSTSVSRVCTHRKNNTGWMPNEVECLVKGISEYGIERWTEMKG
jgi:hypothetical protein